MWAFWKGDNFAKPLAYPLANTPCDRVINAGETCYYPVGVQALFPKDQDLVDLNAQGYVGIPIKDSAGAIIGHLAVIDQRPLKLQDYEMSILKIFSRYAAVEMERLRHHHQYGASTN